MKIEEQIRNDTVILEPLGGIDDRDARVLEERLRRHMRDGRRRIVLDCTSVGIISGAALRVLAAASAACRAFRGQLLIAAIGERTLRLLRDARALQFVDTAETTSDAVVRLQHLGEH